MRVRADIVGVVVVAAGIAAGAARAAAQTGGADVVRRGLVHGGARPPAGFYQTLTRLPGAFEFRHGWLEKARRVRLARQALRARGAWAQLNQAAAPAAAATSATSVGGTLRYPTFLPLFSNTSGADAAVMDTAAVAQRFWGTLPAPANPYSVTTYYREVSVGRLTVTGSVIDTIRVSQTDTFYEGGAGCQGLCGSSRVPVLIQELLRHADSTVNFAAFADSATGTVPAIVVLDPQVGGECYLLYPPAGQSIWAHRFSLSGWGVGPYTTNDSVNGRPVVIDDYIIQGAQGGQTGCTSGQLAPIGTVTHETGHLFGLPDLYDVSGNTEGIGRWDLMSEGNEQKPYRPAHMSAWTLATLGWVTEVPLAASQIVTVGPIETGDTAFSVPIAGTTESFLLENRQPIGSDSMMYGPGLMIYHLDTAAMAARLPSNSVNAVVPHALAIEEAEGDTGLDCTYGTACNDRGDAGDPFPGTSGNTDFGPGTRPSARSNAGAPVGIRLDSIQQVVPFGAMRFRITLGGITTVTASDTGASVQVDGVRTPVFRDLLADGSTHAIAIDTAQLSANLRVAYAFRSWSDGKPAQHTITGSAAGATYTALVARRYLMQVSIIGPGSVSATRTIDPAAGSFLAEGDSVTLTPVPDSGAAFVGWTVDSVTGSSVLLLHAVRPYQLVATFAGTADVLTQLFTGKSALTGGQLLVLDGLGNNNGHFDLGDFVAWLDRNPGALDSRAAGLRRGARR
ncbi:MAG TPA: M6 family metalloprotease domain-containing protein [Gemmatimonadales bacterium]|nr:M6 family metalloprotease domain-containing protein [Gemmatimonadales bacterium]